MTSYDFNVETNKSICPLPFSHSASDTEGRQLLCCISDKYINRLSRYKTVDEYWNSEKLVSVRLDMLAGKKLDECRACYEDEKINIPSRRQTDFSGVEPKDFWEQFSEEELRTGVLTEQHYPVYFDYRTMHCNLACQTCSPGSSTAYLKREKETQGINPLPEMYPRTNEEFEMKQADDMIRAINNRTLKEIYWAGGEPMMSPMHWKVMDTLYDLLETDPDFVNSIRIMYNSNLTRVKWKGAPIYEKLSKFKGLDIIASIDGVGNTYNYIRINADWNTVSNNIKEHQKHFDKTDICTVITNLWILDARRYFEFFDSITKNNSFEFYASSLIQTNFEDPFVQVGSVLQTPYTLSPTWFPKEIMLPAISEILKIPSVAQAIENGADNYVQMKKRLDDLYQKIEEDNNNYSNKVALKMKEYLVRYDSYRKDGLSFGSLLKEINTEAWIWYNSI